VKPGRVARIVKGGKKKEGRVTVDASVAAAILWPMMGGLAHAAETDRSARARIRSDPRRRKLAEADLAWRTTGRDTRPQTSLQRGSAPRVDQGSIGLLELASKGSRGAAEGNIAAGVATMQKPGGRRPSDRPSSTLGKPYHLFPLTNALPIGRPRGHQPRREGELREGRGGLGGHRGRGGGRRVRATMRNETRTRPERKA